MDAMKLQPANPSFIQARDAILAADTARTGGANHLEIWSAFARRGLDEVRLVCRDHLVARHRWHWGREHITFEPLHYLALLNASPAP